MNYWSGRLCGRVMMITALVLTAFCGRTSAQPPSVDPFTAKPPGPGRQNVITSVDLTNAPITTVFRMISDLTGDSIVMSPEVSKSPPKINLWLRNLTAEEVLNRIEEVAGLVKQREGKIVTFMTFDEYIQTYGVAKEVVPLTHARAADVITVLKPFAAKEDQARILAHEQSNSVVLLVPEQLRASLKRLITELDRPADGDSVRVVRLKYLEAAQIAPVIQEFLTGSIRERAPAGKAGAAPEAAPTTRPAGAQYLLKFMIEPALNVIVMRGLAQDIAKAVELISSLDVPKDISVVAYQLKFTDAEEVFESVKELLVQASAADPKERQLPQRLRVVLSAANNQIVVEGSPADQDRAKKIIDTLDRPMPPGTGGVRVYRLDNASSSEVSKVIQAIIQGAPGQPVRSATPSAGREDKSIRRYGPVVTPPGVPPSSAPPVKPAEGEPSAVDVQAAIVTEAPEINAVVIRASAAEHEEFARVIRELDQPRDQVLLEVTLVSVRSDEAFNLGLELSGAHLTGTGTSAIGFSTFGISSVDSTTGALRIATPAPFGANVAVFNADDFSLVLNALRTVGDVRITSAPRILVEDNAAAEIRQINEEPYEVTSQAESSTLTTFGGFVEAGTVLTVTPHLSENSWLRLLYAVTLSSFGTRTAEQIASRLPPPRRQSNLQGTVRVPAGYAVVLGGLVGTREDHTVDEVPYLADIPWLGELFKYRHNQQTNETLYVFIRPVILRDPVFRDLLFLSQKDIVASKVASLQYPQNSLKLLTPTDSEGAQK